MNDQPAEQPQVTYEAHELALLLPEMTAEEFDGLKKSIDKNDQLQPVVIFEGKILDGLHRYRACRELGVIPRTTTLPEDANPVEYVLAANLHRRHLTTSQRAMIAVELKTRFEKEAEERQRAALKQGTSPVVANLPQRENIGRSRDKAAKTMKVSPRSVQDAEQVRQQSPELAEKVKKGEVTVAAAKKQLAASARPTEEPDSQPVGEVEKEATDQDDIFTVAVCYDEDAKALLKQHRNIVMLVMSPIENLKAGPQKSLCSVIAKGTVPEHGVPLDLASNSPRIALEKSWPDALRLSPGLPERKDWAC